jgi:hypothetical protein
LRSYSDRRGSRPLGGGPLAGEIQLSGGSQRSTVREMPAAPTLRHRVASL